jgi:hypothetical protein
MGMPERLRTCRREREGKREKRNRENEKEDKKKVIFNVLFFR